LPEGYNEDQILRARPKQENDKTKANTFKTNMHLLGLENMIKLVRPLENKLA